MQIKINEIYKINGFSIPESFKMFKVNPPNTPILVLKINYPVNLMIDTNETPIINNFIDS
jgi:hypothetical protein